MCVCASVYVRLLERMLRADLSDLESKILLLQYKLDCPITST